MGMQTAVGETSFARGRCLFGVVIVLITEMGVITPPVGVNVYVVYGVVKDVPLETIFKGVLPMLLALLICNCLLLIFPDIALFLPSLMR